MDSTVISSAIGAIAVILAAILPHYLKERRIGSAHKESKSNNLQDSNLKEISTWGGKAQFKYSGSIKNGTVIYFGINSRAEVSADKYKALLKTFKGQTVNVGASFTSDPTIGTMEEWLQKNVTKTSIATYVASILKNECLAIRSKDGKLEFNA